MHDAPGPIQRFVDGGAIDEWLVALRDRLAARDGFVGMWIHGSAATGDWIAGISDVDLVCAWDPIPATGALARLTEILEHAVHEAPTESDVLAIRLTEAREPRRVPRYELYAMHHPRDGPPQVTGPGSEAGLLFDFESARTHGITVAGPPPATVFGSVPRASLLEAADSELAMWQSYSTFRRPDSAVLQAARVSLLAREGRLASKRQAGQWARMNWPPSNALEAAIARAGGDLAAVVDPDEARAIIDRTRAEVAGWMQS